LLATQATLNTFGVCIAAQAGSVMNALKSYGPYLALLVEYDETFPKFILFYKAMNRFTIKQLIPTYHKIALTLRYDFFVL
jgi:hypothetical protein